MFKILTFLFFQTSLVSFTRSAELSAISDYKAVLGGTPHWDVERQSLFYADLFGTEYDILRYDWRENKTYGAVVQLDLNPKVVTSIIPLKCQKDLFVIGVSSRVIKVIRWDGISTTTEIIEEDLFDVEQSEEYSANFWHIAKADPMGRFFGGTFRSEFCSSSSSANASLYRYTKDSGAEGLAEMKLPGGMDWDPQTNTYYFVDVCDFAIKAYDWAPESGQLSNERVAMKLNYGQVAPDYAGISVAVDTDSMIYTSVYNGSAVWKIDPKTSQVLEVFDIPTQIVVNLVFGGPELNVLFITTASQPFGVYSGQPTGQTLTEGGGSLYMLTGLTAPGYGSSKLDIYSGGAQKTPHHPRRRSTTNN